MPSETQVTAPACVNSHQTAHLENPISFRIRRSRRKCDYLMKTMLSNKIPTPYIKFVCGILLRVRSMGRGSRSSQILIQRWLWGRQTDQTEREWRSLEGALLLLLRSFARWLGETGIFNGDQAKIYSVKSASTICSDMGSSFICSLHIYLCRDWCISSTMLGTEDREVNKTDSVSVILQLFTCRAPENGAECGVGTAVWQTQKTRPENCISQWNQKGSTEGIQKD